MTRLVNDVHIFFSISHLICTNVLYSRDLEFR
jgi:hypothetical protein